MDQHSQSPVSPLTPRAPPAPPTSNGSPQTLVTPTVQSTNGQKGSWLPFTFKWYFLLLPIITSLAFTIAIPILIWYSKTHYGLGVDGGSSAVLFGWRFTPTLLAVLYTQLTVILFEDAKRTEPFHRLAKAPAEGASAYGTVLQTPRAWWSVFMDLFKRKAIGKTTWCLICSALINILALLAISPLSSALLTSEEIVITKPLDFNRIVPKTDTRLPFVANRETYFRTMAALMRNISTSAWITDTSLTFPIWPFTEKAQLGPDLVSTYSTWTAETTSLYAGLDCSNMTLESADLTPKQYLAYDVLGHGPYNGTVSMVSFVLKSGDGCRYELSVHPSADIAYNGGLTWSNTSTFFPIYETALNLGPIPFVANVSSTSPYARFHSSKECRDRDIILMNTAWTKPFSVDWSHGPAVQRNQTYERSPDFRMQASLCESNYTMATRNVSASLPFGKQPTIKDAFVGKVYRAPIMDSLLDIPKFQAMTLQDQWKDYFNSISMWTDADSASGGYERPGADRSIRQQVPGFSGLGAFLGALYSFDLTSMMHDEHFIEQAGRVKGRFFTECLREALTDPDAITSNVIKGETTVTEERIIVLKEIGVTLAVLFLVSFALLVLVFWSSRLHCRPLNLQTDPSSTVGQGMLLRSQLARSSTFRSMHMAPRSEFHTALRSDTFYTLNGSLHTSSGGTHTSTAGAQHPQQAFHRWQPLVIRLRMLFALSCLLVAILVAVLVLNAFSARSRLSQLAFIYEADVSKLGLSFSTFAPISIAPTLVSIAIGLWWDQLDTTFRTLQPYIAMSRRPTSIRNGAGLTYRSKTWAGAAIKAACNRHWMLFMIAVGSVLCQILTVSMSALFERRADSVTQQLMLDRTLEPRQTPIITEINAAQDAYSNPNSETHPYDVLDKLLLDPPKNWLPGAAIELSLNGTKLAWTHSGWSFLPLDLTRVPDSTSIQPKANENGKVPIVHATNITVATSALRARLECNPVPEVADVSSWLIHPDKSLFSVHERYNLSGLEDYYFFNHTIFDNSPSNTSVFASQNMIRCCSNGTNEDPQRAAIGYWSPTDAFSFPHADSQWPLPIVTKWIVGRPQILRDSVKRDPTPQILLFKEVPSLQAARCMPIIEVVDATVNVDKDTGVVQSYETTAPITPADSAWSDVFIRHSLSNSTQRYTTNYTGPLNMTTSYGVLFMGSMFKATDPKLGSPLLTYWEDLNDKAFVIRDEEHGLNMDLMTYSMYTLANKDPEALLNYTTLVKHADRTFQTFFQHFVMNGLSLTEGGLAYQKINDDSLKALGPPVAANGSGIPQTTYANLNTNRTVEALVSNRIQVLHMNAVATYLSVAILLWLVGTTAVVTCLQRKYTRSMIWDVQLIADVLVLIAASDNFLRLVHERGVDLKKDTEVKTMLGWFKGRDREVRWGVEVVGGSAAVEWVDAPKQGWHIREKRSLKERMPTWRS